LEISYDRFSKKRTDERTGKYEDQKGHVLDILEQARGHYHWLGCKYNPVFLVYTMGRVKQGKYAKVQGQKI
jgi:hypothetical protein